MEVPDRMRMTYDQDADAAYIYVSEESHEATDFQTCGPLEVENASIILIYNPSHHLIGVEVLGASRLLGPDSLAAADSAS
jgi:uncharacterized protein YuzE